MILSVATSPKPAPEPFCSQLFNKKKKKGQKQNRRFSLSLCEPVNKWNKLKLTRFGMVEVLVSRAKGQEFAAKEIQVRFFFFFFSKLGYDFPRRSSFANESVRVWNQLKSSNRTIQSDLVKGKKMNRTGPFTLPNAKVKIN